MRISAIIQARMTSSRLPGKVLKTVKGRPLLDYLIERLNFCKRLANVIIATTTNSQDDPIVAFAKSRDCKYYRGSENDVLSRYYEAATVFEIDHIVRLTSDCPLIDPGIIDNAIERYQLEACDYLHLAPSFAEGLDTEIFSYKILEVAHRDARLMAEREHVSLYFHNNPDRVHKVVIDNTIDDSMYRLTVDEAEDYAVVKAIYEALYEPGRPPFGMREIKEFFKAHPEIYKINAHILRNEGLLISLKKENAAAERAKGKYTEKLIGNGTFKLNPK
jgi:spore coat polysaccharide biosynthesis protein SpsF